MTRSARPRLRSDAPNGSIYYTLAYTPENHNWNGQFRKIAVKLGQHGYSLAYRRGYYALPDQPATAGDPADTLRAGLQPDTPELTMLRLRSQVQLPDAQRPAVRIDSVIDPANVDFSTDAQGRRHAHLLVSLIAIPETTQRCELNIRPRCFLRCRTSAKHFTIALHAISEYSVSHKRCSLPTRASSPVIRQLSFLVQASRRNKCPKF